MLSLLISRISQKGQIRLLWANNSRMLVACLLVIFGYILLCQWLPNFHTFAQEDCSCSGNQSELDCNLAKQNCLTQKISQTQNQANSLANLISVLNGQIAVQELQVKQTQLEITKLETEITELHQRISGLNVSLDRMTNALIERVSYNYRQQQTHPLELLLIANSVQDYISRLKYLQLAQNHTTNLMEQAESQKNDYDKQKKLKEDKQTQVEQKKTKLQQQQNSLASQKKDQETLLKQTRNDEARYQAELAKTLAELGAIQSIVAGGGEETFVRDVGEQETIASVIQGSSTCSTGTHLHFEVITAAGHQNPANYLKPISATWNNSPDTSFSFSGGWEWPVNDPAKINQGYGMTWYARVRRSYGGAPHTGIDLVSKNGTSAVKSVKAGKLFRGSIKCGGGHLRYVKVDHGDNLATLYLHVNY